jgi:hypothetical protein
MRARGEHDAVDRESTARDALVDALPAKDRGALKARADSLNQRRRT